MADGSKPLAAEDGSRNAADQSAAEHESNQQ
jgi:hypothetical protein